MAVKALGEITAGRKENRISEHNKATTQEKITSVCVCVYAVYFKGRKKDCNTYNNKLSFCLFTPVLK